MWTSFVLKIDLAYSDVARLSNLIAWIKFGNVKAQGPVVCKLINNP